MRRIIALLAVLAGFAVAIEIYWGFGALRPNAEAVSLLACEEPLYPAVENFSNEAGDVFGPLYEAVFRAALALPREEADVLCIGLPGGSDIPSGMLRQLEQDNLLPKSKCRLGEGFGPARDEEGRSALFMEITREPDCSSPGFCRVIVDRYGYALSGEGRRFVVSPGEGGGFKVESVGLTSIEY